MSIIAISLDNLVSQHEELKQRFEHLRGYL